MLPLPAAAVRFFFTVRRPPRLHHHRPNLYIPVRSFVNHHPPTNRSILSRAHSAPYPTRTHSCAALNLSHVGSSVVLAGWLSSARKAGKTFAFFPLRDATGSAQLVVHADTHATILATMQSLPAESVVLVEGLIRARPPSQRRPVPSGDIEVQVTSFILLNRADQDLPFMPSDVHNLANEDLRLRHRYLDLRRPALADNIRKRSHVAHIVRTVLHDHDFSEVETPILLKSSPEGAREFLVPTRVSAHMSGRESSPLFYALPQSPQQPKQLLVVSGVVDRYYQLARCFRDEDGRKDRQPEFTQIDLEMAWVSWGPSSPTLDPVLSSPRDWRIGGKEVKEVVEALIRKIWSDVEGVELPKTFPIMTYADAMARYGSDKPDQRFGLEIQDVTHLLPDHLKAELTKRGEVLEALIVNSSSGIPFRRAAASIRQDPLERGVETVHLSEAGVAAWFDSSDILRGLGVGEIPEQVSRLTPQALGGDGFMWVAKRHRIPEGGSTPLGRTRLALLGAAQSSGDLKLSSQPHFLWVTEFPLFTRADSDKDFLARGRWSSSHHPFTAPMWNDIEKMYDGRISEVRGQHYDLVLNGVEIGGGSVRVHDPSMQEYIFSEILQLDSKERACFSHLLHALRCGAPPHGGIALGFDRLMAILCKAESIRDVIAFPKTSVGTDPLFNSPAAAPEDVLQQYHLCSR